jgi:type II secretory pathway pseudopilin PulG
MVVVGIMSVILTMGVPIVYKAFHKAAMNKAIADVVEICSNTRRSAILNGQKANLTFQASQGATTIANTSLPSGVEIAKLYINGIDCMRYSSATVVFYPDGTSNELLLQLFSEKGERAEISLEVTTGLASVERDWSKFRLR